MPSTVFSAYSRLLHLSDTWFSCGTSHENNLFGMFRHDALLSPTVLLLAARKPPHHVKSNDTSLHTVRLTLAKGSQAAMIP